MLDSNDGIYLCGNEPSIADLLCYFETTNLVFYEMMQIMDDFPKLKKWYNKIS